MEGHIYDFVVEGRLGDAFAAQFGGFDVVFGDGQTTLTGHVADQAQLYAVIQTLRELEIRLVAVQPR